MAFSFTLPELRAELRALGHDGLPDRLILTFLSQLNLPLPSASAHKASFSHSSSSDSSGYDTEASTCSTHLPSCGNDIPKGCSTCREYSDDGAGTRCAEHQPSLSDVGEFISTNFRTKIVLPPAELCDGGSLTVTACTPVEGGFRNGRGLSSAEPHFQSCHPLRSRAPFEHEETLSRGTDVENITENCINGKRFVESADINVDKRGHASVGHVRNRKRPDAVLTTGCGARSRPQQVKGQDRQVSTDKIIEHYWISVGEEHMRAMHSKSSKETEQQLGASVLENHGIDGTSESKSGCGSLIEKVQQCEDELQCLTLSLQAQQCKKPLFLEAARKPKGFHDMEKQIFCGKNVFLSASDGTLATDLELTQAEGCETSSCPGQLCMVKPTNTQMILETHANVSEAPSSSSLDHVRECLEAACENLVTSEKRSQQQLDIKIDEAVTLETTLATTFCVSEHDELEPAGQHEDKENTMFCDLCPDQKGDPDPSVCSKSSSASYQHSTGSSGDSRSNVSQQMSTHSSSTKPPRSTSQQQKRRGGKIDRVARFHTHDLTLYINMEKEDPMLTEQVESVFVDLVESMIMDVASEAHRAARLGMDPRLDIDEEEEYQLSVQARISVGESSISGSKKSKHGVDIFGQTHPAVANAIFECMNCNRNIMAGRFAPHLEKCMGKGRRARAQTTNNTKSDPQRTKRTFQKAATMITSSTPTVHNSKDPQKDVPIVNGETSNDIGEDDAKVSGNLRKHMRKEASKRPSRSSTRQ